MTDPLIEAAYRDQERRVLEADPIEFRVREPYRRHAQPLFRGERISCAAGCGKRVYACQASPGRKYICRKCRNKE